MPPQGDDEGVAVASAPAAAAGAGTAETANKDTPDAAEKVNLDAYGPKELRTSKRLRKMKEYECAICMVQLQKQPKNEALPAEEFFKTPCNHKFHKSCLVDWMDQKHTCPNCRANIPIYQEL